MAYGVAPCWATVREVAAKIKQEGRSGISPWSIRNGDTLHSGVGLEVFGEGFVGSGRCGC
jgi:hypothetical protein